MTTRREFIQGIFVGMITLILPKTAKVSESGDLVVEPEHDIRIDGRDSMTWSDTLLGCPIVYSSIALEDKVYLLPIEFDGSGETLPEASSTWKVGKPIERRNS